ncbi:MAG: periplasmic heavy metal sensor, partial [bacterium]
MKRSISVLLLGAFLVMALVPMLSAQSRKGIATKKKMPRQKICKGLNLTDEQKSKIADLRLAHQKEILPLQTELQGKMAELSLLKTEDKADLKKIDQLIEQAEKTRTKIQKAKVRHQLEVRKILTPEQQKIW